jgi:hypothetical protein
MLREEVDSSIKKWAVISHLSAFAGILIILPVPFGNIIAPAIIWVLKGSTHPYLDEQARESINFQISMTLYCIIAGVLSLLWIGFPILIGLVLFNIFCIVKATMSARDGYHYKYPISLRLMHDLDEDSRD